MYPNAPLTSHQHLHHLFQLLPRRRIAALLCACVDARRWGMAVRSNESMCMSSRAQLSKGAAWRSARHVTTHDPMPQLCIFNVPLNSLEMYFSGSARNALASAGVFSRMPSNSDLQICRWKRKLVDTQLTCRGGTGLCHKQSSVLWPTCRVLTRYAGMQLYTVCIQQPSLTARR